MVYEYSKTSVSGNSCSYSNLCKYNNSSCSYDGVSGGVMPPVPSTTRAIQVVPSFGTFGYQTACTGRSGRGGTCAGYFPISNAYPDYDGCAHYTSNLCSGSGPSIWP